MDAKKFIFLTIILMLFSCANSKTNVDHKATYWGPYTNYSVLFEGRQPTQCGIIYSGHWKKSFLRKENKKIINIVNCSSQSRKQGDSYIIEYHLSYLPDLHQIRKVVFQPERKGLVITYSEEEIGSWEILDVQKCESLYPKNTKLFMNKCTSDVELKQKLLQGT
jgi:hypothetical protein